MASDASNRFNYSLFFKGSDAFYDLRINDVSVWKEFDANPSSKGVPVTHFLQTGLNTLSVTFVSVMGDPYAYNAPNPAFFFEAELDRRVQGHDSGKEITLINAGLDALTNTVVFPDARQGGAPFKSRNNPPMRVGLPTLDDSTLQSGWGDTWQARRITVSFEINDALPTAPYADAPKLDASTEFKAELLQAYQTVQTAIAAGDTAQVRALYGPAWSRIATALHYANVDEFMERGEIAGALAATNDQGQTVQPLDLVLGPQAFQVDFMADGRLARIIPDPIIWSDGTADSGVSASAIGFFRDTDGALRIGVVTY
ncbi:hypothetical protein [Nereida sp. MMG025]|uniref:hypothetical protein n=1 Tax=Nereida sp. MMG025 TaxID=2909981 RepID=UPI001F2E75E4|nr:hypothetical protein [Nereida sp. MMG025]MCF6445888.1 hypothetical protein [Nereida sp. MMG025]